MKLDHQLRRLEKLSNSNTGGYIITFADDMTKSLHRDELFIACITSTINIKNIIKNNCAGSKLEDDFFISICKSLSLLNNTLH